MSRGYFQPWIINFSAVKFFALKTPFKRASAKFKLTILAKEVPRKSTLEPPRGFECGTAELGIQHLNHSTIAP